MDPIVFVQLLMCALILIFSGIALIWIGVMMSRGSRGK